MSKKFKVLIEHTCSACSYNLSECSNECPCEVCGGDIRYKEWHTVDESDLVEVE